MQKLILLPLPNFYPTPRKRAQFGVALGLGLG